MLLRLSLFIVGFVLFYLSVAQLIVPALLGKPILTLFRGENRLDKAKRLKAEALERKEATLTEVEAIKIETESKQLRDEAFKDLTGGRKA